MSAFLIAARRTAVMPRGGAFASLTLHDLAAPVIRAWEKPSGSAASGKSSLMMPPPGLPRRRDTTHERRG